MGLYLIVWKIFGFVFIGFEKNLVGFARSYLVIIDFIPQLNIMLAFSKYYKTCIVILLMFCRTSRQERFHPANPGCDSRPRKSRRDFVGQQRRDRSPVRTNQGHPTLPRLLRRPVRSSGEPAQEKCQQGAPQRVGLHAPVPRRFRRICEHHKTAFGSRS